MIIPFQTKVSGLLVKVPERSKSYDHRRWIFYNTIVFYEDIKGDVPLKGEDVYIGKGLWEPIGEIASLTEKQKKLVCADSDSFSSLLKSLEVYSENPIEITQDEEEDNGAVGLIATVAHFRAEERTGKWLLLIKKED